MPFDYTGSFSGSFTGDLTSTNGVISSSAQVSYTQIRNKPTTISAFQANSILANTNFRQTSFVTYSSSISDRVTTQEVTSASFSTRVTTLENQVDSDNQTLSLDGTTLSISSGNSVSLASIGGASDYTELTNVPVGIISSSAQITALGYSTSDSDAQTLTISGQTLTISNGNSVTLPIGGVGGSSIWTTGSQDPVSYTYVESSNNLQLTGSFRVSGGVTGSLLGTATTASFISDTFISASAARSGFGAGGGGSTDISALNTFTGSIQTEVDSLTAATSSYLTSVPSGTLSGSAQVETIIDDTYISASAAASGFGAGGGVSVPDGTISSSAQITSLTNVTLSGTSTITSADINGGTIDGVTIGGTLAGNATFASVDINGGTIDGVTIGGALAGNATFASVDINGGTIDGVAIGGALTTFGNFTAITASTSITTPDVYIDGWGSVSASLASVNGGGGSSATASYVAGLSDFNGNRVVSNPDLPTNIFNVNFGTSGSISNFIEKIFFPNSAPSVTTSGFTIQEFEVSGSAVGTVLATDAESQAVTFRTASSYTDDFFKIASNGQVTLNTKSTSSMNTDSTPTSGSHPFQIEAVDSIGAVGSKTIYIRVNPNTAPVWRQTSVGGSIITSFTSSLNENSGTGEKFKVYFTDTESDTMTIDTGSIPSEFSASIASTYVQVNQVTASLDYESTTSYNLTFTVEDQHYTDGDDSTTISTLPILIRVVDNVAPVVNNQTLSSINENSSNGTVVDTITATDTEGDTITFSNFTLLSAYLNGVGTNITSSLGGNSLYDPHADPFQANSSGQVTRKTGVYLNADIADRYVYQVSVKDSYNNTTDTGQITIPITDDSAASITDNWDSLHIMESVGTNYYVRKEGGILGLTGTFAQLSSAGGSVIQRWEVSSTGDMIKASNVTGSATYLQANQNISGSIYTSGSIIAVAITASEHAFETTKQYFDYTIKVEPNSAPDIIFTNTAANLNTNAATSGSLLTTITFSDVESDTIDHSTFSFTDPSGQLNSVKSGDSYLIQAKNNLSGSTTYEITASIQDTHRFRTNTEEHTFTIAQSAPTTYVYGWTGGSAASEAAAIASMGDSGGDGIGIVSGSVIAMLQSGSIGSTFTPSYVGGTATLHKSGSITTLSDTDASGLSTLGYLNFSSTSQRLLVVFASASALGGKPVSMYDGVPPDSTGTPNEYYVYAKDAAIPGTIGTGVYYFDTESDVEGYSRWGVIFAEGKNTNNSRYYLMPDTASAP